MSYIKYIRSFVLLFVLPSLCFAQTNVDQATRESNRPVLDELQRKLETPPQKTPPQIHKEEKKVTKSLRFFVKKIHLIGVESFPEDQFKSTIAEYEKKEISLEDLNTLAKAIESEYLLKGIIAAVFSPPQVMTDGIMILQVVEAKMGELEIPDHKYFKKKRIEYYWAARKGSILHYDKILKSLQLLNKNPDRQVTATLHAGKVPQTTDVALKVTTKFPIHLTSSVDREGVTSTGKNRYGVGVRHNNFLSIDDTLITGSVFGKSFSSIYVYHSIPLTNFGTSIVYGYNYSRSIPKKEFGSLGLYSNAATTSVLLKQALYKNGKERGEVNFGIDAKDKNTRQDTGDINSDRLRILRLGGLWTLEGKGSITSFQPKVSQGINGFGARARNALSSRNADNVFTKFNFDVQHKKALPFMLQTSFQLKTQIASNRLTPQEEFDLGGIDSVRGYSGGDFLADDAVQTNLELLAPAYFIPAAIKLPFAKKPLREQITLVSFADYGWGNKRHILSGEKDTDNLFGVGAGLRIQLLDNMLIRLEWGFPVGDKTITESANSRFHFSIDFQN